MWADQFRADPDKFSLKDCDPRFTAGYTKTEARNSLTKGLEELLSLQDRFYAYDRYALLVIFQALDAAGKDSTIKHVMSGVNPSGCEVYGFKGPTSEELDHDFMWRTSRRLPHRGRIGIFNRSYYEEVLVVRVHPEYLAGQRLPPEVVTDDIWKERFRDINNLEHYLARNGTHILKFFLHVSKAEQKKRFLERIADESKNWKFSAADLKERALWDDYQRAYEDMIRHTSTKWAPWYVIPADRKWFTRLAVAEIILSALRDMDPQYPTVTDEQRRVLEEAKVQLESED
jgi:PPK2 family polyphosphate:nucleotide phosphotransferase